MNSTRPGISHQGFGIHPADRRSRRRLGVCARRQSRSLAQLQDHRALVGHDHRHREVHRLRQLRPRLLGGKQRARGIFPHLGGTLLMSRTGKSRIRRSILPTARMNGFPEVHATKGQELLRSQALQSLRGFAVRAGVPCRRDFRLARRRGPGRREILPGLPLLHPGLSLRMPFSDPRNKRRAEVHALLSPHHQRTDHRLLRSLPHCRAPAGGSQESQGSRSRISEDAQRAGPQTADGDRCEGLL